ncbi:MAG: 2-oxoacid:acceptor oxidoreductase subunit alpha [Deltaproteobacteria bacterium]|nr:2-oxoacid:acceptor oxidoreductase subunit alpha [Deltaproteobacteria bacterium]
MTVKTIEKRKGVSIRFCGDSGDGMQLTGTKFTDETAMAGNDLSTFPDFPAEIRAPAGTMAGVSGFQIHFASDQVYTPSDYPDVLVAFNPAAARANVGDLRPGAMLIINVDAFNKKSWQRAGYTEDPLPDLRERFELVEIPLTRLNREALVGLDLSQRAADRCKNFFSLGLLSWLYNRPMESTERWLSSKFKGDVLEANLRTLRAGWAFGETTELFPVSYQVPAAKIESGTYRNITGNTALAWGIVAARVLMDREVFLGAYPITPATDVLHEVARHRNFGVKTFQAEDEMAAVSSAIGASFAGNLGVTVSSGPGIMLKQEAIGLAIMVELPLVIIDVQRSGPSTGSPTKTEQGDLLLALFGRSSESPMPVLAPASASGCFDIMIEAFRLAVKYMTPVMVLSDSYLANSSEPWKIPDVETLPRSPIRFATLDDFGEEGFQVYRRDSETFARPWAIPGEAGLEHRLGGLTKEPVTGNVVYDPENHAEMVRLRREKIERIAADVPNVDVDGPDSGDLLVLGWGSTSGAITAAVAEAREAGLVVSRAHICHMNPLPSNLGDALRRFKHVLLPELNGGQLCMILRSKFLIDIESLTKVAGQPFRIAEIREGIENILSKEN